jgi:hypothetical protein
MPEAAIDENRKTSPGKDDVRSHESPWDANRKVDPKAKSPIVQLAAHSKLRAAISSAIAAHSLSYPSAGGGRIGK